MKDAAPDPALASNNPVFGRALNSSGFDYPAAGSLATVRRVERQAPQPAPFNGVNSEEVLAERLGLSSGKITVMIDADMVRQAMGDKLAMMLGDMVMARELTYFAARAKDSGKRCDIEAGMAKLLAARVAWTNADASLQIHGSNGYALDYEISRVLCDARILGIFKGGAEIQAQVIARGKLQDRN